MASLKHGLNEEVSTIEYTKRQRSTNWGYDEKATLLALVKERISSIESKSADGVMLAKKKKAWMEVKEEFEARHGGRELKRIKEQWRRMKVHSKDAIEALRKYENGTAGRGPFSENMVIPTEQDLEIQRILPRQPSVNCNISDDGGNIDHPVTAPWISANEEPQQNTEGSEADQPMVSYHPLECIEIEPTEIPGSSSPAEMPEIPPKRQRKKTKRRNNTSEEIFKLLKIQSSKTAEERQQMKRKGEMEEVLHSLQVGICKKQAELLNVKLETKKFKLLYWKRKCESLI